MMVRGGEGMVVKLLIFIVCGKKGFIQFVVKVWGKEYFCIIYGFDYDVLVYLE